MNPILCAFIVLLVHVIAGKSVLAGTGFNSSSYLDAKLQPISGKRIRAQRASPRYTQPFMVAIIDRFSREISCGGTIINPQRVVTAGHCFDGKDKDDYYVAAGEKYLDKAHPGSHNVRDIDSVTFNNFRYRSRIPINDIAYLKISTPFHFTDKINSIPIAEDHVFEGIQCTTIGWGIINNDRDQPNPLKEFEMVVLANDKCARLIDANNNGVEFIHQEINNMICATPLRDSVKPCKGDSGSPLICNNEFHGIVSFTSVGCNTDNFPVVFARVVNYRNFLT